MSKAIRRPRTALLVLAMLLGPYWAIAAETVIMPLKFAIDSQVSMTIQGAQPQKVTADTEVDYSLHRTGNSIDIVFNEVRVKALMADSVLVDSTMSRAGMENRTPGQAFKYALEEAPPALKQMLMNEFGAPVCTYEVDAEGKETKRSVPPKLAKSSIVQTGQITNARLFHTAFPANKASWDAPAAVSGGSGISASGDLHYERQEDKALPDNLVRVKVSGTLIPKGKQNGLDMLNGKYEVKGYQIYNKTKREWTSGELQLQVSFDLFQEKNKVASAKGTMAISLSERKPEKP